MKALKKLNKEECFARTNDGGEIPAQAIRESDKARRVEDPQKNVPPPDKFSEERVSPQGDDVTASGQLTKW